MKFEVCPVVMKVAIPHWQGRVSPVFDVARNLLVVDTDDGVERARQDLVLVVEEPQLRAARLAAIGADVLICGAISRPLEVAVVAAGIDVIPQTCGDVENVLAAFLDRRLRQDTFLMPGCCGRRRQLRLRRRHGRSGRRRKQGNADAGI